MDRFPLIELCVSCALTQAVELATPEEKERQRRLGGVVAEFSNVKYSLVVASPDTEGSSQVLIIVSFAMYKGVAMCCEK